MGLEDVILVGSVREKVRTHALTMSPVGIMDRIKAWGSVEPLSPSVGVVVPPSVPRSQTPRPERSEVAATPVTPRFDIWGRPIGY